MFLVHLLVISTPLMALVAIIRAEMSRREVSALSARVLELRTRLRAAEAAEDARKLSAAAERSRHTVESRASEDRPLTAGVGRSRT